MSNSSWKLICGLMNLLVPFHISQDLTRKEWWPTKGHQQHQNHKPTTQLQNWQWLQTQHKITSWEYYEYENLMKTCQCSFKHQNERT